MTSLTAGAETAFNETLMPDGLALKRCQKKQAMPRRKLIPDVVHDQNLLILTRETPVSVAVKRMIESQISAVMITENGTAISPLLGIFTGQDLAGRVVGAGRDPRQTRLDSVMTWEPDTLPPEASAWDALIFMQNRNYRHLPVVQDDQILGMVSIRDLLPVVTVQLEEAVAPCETFAFGSGYSLDSFASRYRH